MSSIEKFDWRKIENGLRIPAITYSDQPYVVRTDAGAWLCCITTGSGDGTTFSPGQNCTRAQIVTFLYRSYHN